MSTTSFVQEAAMSVIHFKPQDNQLAVLKGDNESLRQRNDRLVQDMRALRAELEEVRVTHLEEKKLLQRIFQEQVKGFEALVQRRSSIITRFRSAYRAQRMKLHELCVEYAKLQRVFQNELDASDKKDDEHLRIMAVKTSANEVLSRELLKESELLTQHNELLDDIIEINRSSFWGRAKRILAAIARFRSSPETTQQ